MKCNVLENGGYANGKWVKSSVIANRSLLTNLQTVYRTHDAAGSSPRNYVTEHYDWIPNDCVLRRFVIRNVCRKLKNKHILFVGDSITYRNALSFWKQISPNTEQEPKFGRKSTVMTCDSSLRVTSIVNDQLQNSPCNDDRCHPFFHTILRADVVVVNTGAHWRQTNAKILSLRRLYAHLAHHKFSGLLLYRLTAPGHPKCKRYSRPLSFNEMTQYDFRNLQNPGYHWEEYEVQNQHIIDFLSAQSIRTHIVDIVNLTKMRPDGHDPPDDCLHYFLPSVYDTWSLIEWNFMWSYFNVDREYP